MSIVKSLRPRIETAQRDLESFLNTREAEIQAMAESWRQTRERFDGLENDVQVYRTKLVEVEAEHKELAELVEALLGVIDKSTRPRADRTAPHAAGITETVTSDGRMPKKCVEQDTLVTTTNEAREMSAASSPREATTTQPSETQNIVASSAERSHGREGDDALDIPVSDEPPNLKVLRSALDRAAFQLSDFDALFKLKASYR